MILDIILQVTWIGWCYCATKLFDLLDTVRNISSVSSFDFVVSADISVGSLNRVEKLKVIDMYTISVAFVVMVISPHTRRKVIRNNMR